MGAALRQGASARGKRRGPEPGRRDPGGGGGGRPRPGRGAGEDLHRPQRRPRPHRHELDVAVAGDGRRHQRHLHDRPAADGRVPRVPLHAEPGVRLRDRAAVQPGPLREDPGARGRGALGGRGQPVGRGRQEPRLGRGDRAPPPLHPPLHGGGARAQARGRADRLGARHLRPRPHDPDPRLPRGRHALLHVPGRPGREAARLLVARAGRRADPREPRDDLVPEAGGAGERLRPPGLRREDGSARTG